jgi:hypothetical protein
MDKLLLSLAGPIAFRRADDSGSGEAAAGFARRETTPDSLRRSQHALNLLLTHRGNPSAEIDQLLADDPGFAFAHCLRAALIVSSDAVGERASLAESLVALAAACPDTNDPARRHAAGARAWLEGDPSLAAEIYGAIVIDRPRDVLALAVAHSLDFRLGRRRMMLNRMEQVLPEWRDGMSGLASVIAMHAFALEENGQLRRAERLARRALMLDPGHPGAVHVIAHVLEMQGRAAEGLDFLAETEPFWAAASNYSVHLAWHRALFQLDAESPASALATYDAQIATARPYGLSVLADASALLWRLQLRDMEIGARWQELADHWQTQTLAGARPFYVVHAIMAFAAAGRADAALRVLKSLLHAHVGGALSPVPEDALLLPFSEALLAFARKDYVACIDLLTHVRHATHQCGGSLAQCDLFHLTFTEAALRARRARLARALLAERAAQKPASRLNRLLQQRLRKEAPLPATDDARLQRLPASGQAEGDCAAVRAGP